MFHFKFGVTFRPWKIFYFMTLRVMFSERKGAGPGKTFVGHLPRVKRFLHVCTFNPAIWAVLLPFFRCGNRGSERWGKGFSKVRQNLPDSQIKTTHCLEGCLHGNRTVWILGPTLRGFHKSPSSAQRPHLLCSEWASYATGRGRKGLAWC